MVTLLVHIEDVAWAINPAAKEFHWCSWELHIYLGGSSYNCESQPGSWNCVYLLQTCKQAALSTSLTDWSVWRTADTNSRAVRGGASLPGKSRHHYDRQREQKDLQSHNQNLEDYPILSVVNYRLYLWSYMNSSCIPPHFILFNPLQSSLHGWENWLSNLTESPNSRFGIWTLVRFMLRSAKENTRSGNLTINLNQSP